MLSQVKETDGSASLPPVEPSLPPFKPPLLKETYGSASLPPFEPSLIRPFYISNADYNKIDLII